ncbi:hypothetical protein [Oleiharenicola sp. Vm1]|uniref:hypothetical protein n=1 Tax=Oleiharenicola sp. Vm1 TaxID=3398393 RepID=UPI0039F4D16F
MTEAKRERGDLLSRMDGPAGDAHPLGERALRQRPLNYGGERRWVDAQGVAAEDFPRPVGPLRFEADKVHSRWKGAADREAACDAAEVGARVALGGGDFSRRAGEPHGGCMFAREAPADNLDLPVARV